MGELTFAVPTLFGLEGLCADEMRRLDIANVKAETAGCCAPAVPSRSPG